MATCKACGASIVWIKSRPNEKWIPCDEELIRYKQDNAGKHVLISDNGNYIRCHLQFDGLPTGMARVPHWATCPHADVFRRGNVHV
jgi:hypothetical protein